MKLPSIAVLALVAWMLPHPARAQTCLGLPLEPGGHAVGALVETETGYSLLAAQYAGSSRALAWRAHAGGVMRGFPGSFPSDLAPAAGGGLALLGGSRAMCPTLGVEYFDDDPESHSLEPGDSDLDVSIVTLGWGAGFSTLADSTRLIRAIVYLVPQLRWVRESRKFDDVEDVEIDRQVAFEAGITATGRRLWGGGGARVRYRENNDYPLDAVLLVRGGVRW
ncbi:hypothetical protein BH20GEM1_BH20GEM1_13100 [soil metagenome]